MNKELHYHDLLIDNEQTVKIMHMHEIVKKGHPHKVSELGQAYVEGKEYV